MDVDDGGTEMRQLRKPTRYTLTVYQIVAPGVQQWQWIVAKHFNSKCWAKRYLAAIHKRYPGDRFRADLWCDGVIFELSIKTT